MLESLKLLKLLRKLTVLLPRESFSTEMEWERAKSKESVNLKLTKSRWLSQAWD